MKLVLKVLPFGPASAKQLALAKPKSLRNISGVCKRATEDPPNSAIWSAVLSSCQTDETVRRLYAGLVGCQRSALAESITLVESTQPARRIRAQALLTKILTRNNDFDKDVFRPRSFRIGLSGPPGAGKSTFLEVFGKYLTSNAHRVAILAVDPSSCTTGGSLLGDKTRMPELSRDSNAYIRPSPTSGQMGGVNRNTAESVLLCEVAGYDVIFVETVGVGQSEFAVADMVDMFVLLLSPAGGDELQGLKRGIVEKADLIVINKADGDLLPAARRMQYEYTSALKFLKSRSKHWKTKVISVSAYTSEGIPQLWSAIQEYNKIMLEKGELEARRRDQRSKHMWNHISDRVMESFRSNPRVQRIIGEVQENVNCGRIVSGLAADILLEEFSNG